MKYIGAILLIAVSFFSGAYWNKHQLLDSGPVELISDLRLQANIDNLGILPKGTVLYPYSYKGEIATFVVFVNTKRLDLLQPIKLNTPTTISPIDGYID